MIYWRYLAVMLALFSFQACNSVNFRGGAANSPSPQDVVSFNCEASPSTVEFGASLQIAITASTAYDLEVFQKVVNGDQAVDSTLKFTDGSYKTEDGGENTLTANFEGKNTVELRSTAGGEVKGQCEFTVNPKPSEPPPPVCEESKELVGANVAFIIDNSFSNATTDCDGFDQNLWRTQQKALCRNATNREKAVLAAFDTLEGMAKEREYNERSKSHLAIASFPTKEDRIGGGVIRTKDGWIESTQDGRSSLEAGLEFSREPIGYTPYGAGLAQAKTLFGDGFDSHGDKAKVAVLVTDGEPTDQNPRETKAIAAELKEMGIKLITVYVLDGSSRKDRRASHIEFLEDENNVWKRNQNRNWFDQSEFNAMDDYLAELMGDDAGNGDLISAITSKTDEACVDSADATCERNIVEVTNSAALMETFKALAMEATTCE